MTGEADLATIGSLLADRTRATFLLTLLNGGLTPSSVLAERASVSRSLASTHLRKLVDGGLVVVEPKGRQRLYRLAGQSIADALEVLLLLAPSAPVRSLADARERDALRQGRLCYDHLAGRAGVAVADALLALGFLVRSGDGLTVTRQGERTFAGLGIDVDALRARPRPLTRGCTDWSEGRAHLAGSLGAALTAEMLRRDWLAAREASRAVVVTPAGADALVRHFGVTHESLARQAA